MYSDRTLKPYLSKLSNNLEKEKQTLARWFYTDRLLKKQFLEWLDNELDLMKVVLGPNDISVSVFVFNWTRLANKVERLCASVKDYDERSDIAKIIEHVNRPLKLFAQKLYQLCEKKPIDENLLMRSFFTLIELNQKMLQQTTWSGMIAVTENVEKMFNIQETT